MKQFLCSKRTIISTLLLFLMVAFYIFAKPIATELSSMSYIFAPGILLKLVYNPLLMLVLGWCSMNFLGYLLKAKPIHHKIAKLCIFLFLSLILLIFSPLFIWLFSGSSYFHSNVILTKLTDIHISYPFVYTFLGSLLWVVGFPQKKEK